MDLSRSQRRLAAQKSAKLATVEALRDARRYANVTALGHTWQADATSQELIGKAINLGQAGLPLPDQWRDADNINMTVTSINELLTIAGAMATQTQNAYTWSWAKKALIEAAANTAELNLIDLT